MDNYVDENFNGIEDKEILFLLSPAIEGFKSLEINYQLSSIVQQLTMKN